MGSELLITLVVAWFYITLVRFVDHNEREPVWALAVVFGFGAVGACLVNLLLGSAALTIPLWRGALAVETTKLLALAGGILVFAGVARIRGWSEFSDVTDGLIYGITVGLGYSVGETFVREVQTARFVSVHLLETPWQSVTRAALSGLSHGAFGAMVGLGCGAVLEARSRAGRALAPLVGLAMAVVLDALFRILAHGDALSGRPGWYRAWLAVLLPVAGFIAIGLVALTAERRAIQQHLSAEPDAGLVSTNDLELLRSFWGRQRRYAGLLVRGRLADALHLAARHNRQVQLALLLRRLAREPNPERSQRLRRQADLVRAAIRQLRPVLLLLLAVLGLSCRPHPRPEQPSSPPAPSPAEPNPTQSPPSSEPSRPAAEPTAPAGEPSTGTLDSLFARSRRDIDEFWRKQVGDTYRSPNSVGPYSVLSFECPPRTRNASYCAGDHAIYYDADWLDAFRREAGEFAPVFVLAHEWGHLVQDLRGEFEPKEGWWNLQIELQADCMAGEWSRDAVSRGFVTPGAEDQALAALRRLRDPIDYPWFRADAHGDGAQRIAAFLEGDEGRPCAGEDFWRRVHLDRDALHQAPTPPSGSQLVALACRVGRFQRQSVSQLPAEPSTVVTDMIQATFRSTDGVEISYLSAIFVSEPAAQGSLETFLEKSKAKGYQIAKEGPVKDGERRIGQWDLLEGPTEIVVLRNGKKYTVYEGPSGAAWEFGTVTDVDYSCNNP